MDRFCACCAAEVMSFMLLLRPFAKMDSMSIYSSKARRKSREEVHVMKTGEVNRKVVVSFISKWGRCYRH
jgi:hypothetical protein